MPPSSAEKKHTFIMRSIISKTQECFSQQMVGMYQSYRMMAIEAGNCIVWQRSCSYHSAQCTEPHLTLLYSVKYSSKFVGLKRFIFCHVPVFCTVHHLRKLVIYICLLLLFEVHIQCTWCWTGVNQNSVWPVTWCWLPVPFIGIHTLFQVCNLQMDWDNLPYVYSLCASNKSLCQQNTPN
jgi:hypothetical protein